MQGVSEDTRLELAALCCERAAEGAPFSRGELLDVLGECCQCVSEAACDAELDTDSVSWLLLSQLVYPQRREPDGAVLRMRLGDYELVVKETR